MKIAVAGVGYVGISIAILLSQKHDIIALDIDPKKVQLINKKYHQYVILKYKNFYLIEN